jgi:4-hydroxy-tetrahydrodipicolinate reductase
MTRLALLGAQGRLGSVIARLALAEAAPTANPGWQLSTYQRGQSLPAFVESSEVIIEVSHHSITAELVRAVQTAPRPLIVGSTGHDAAELELLRQASQMVPLVLAPNFSVGVALLFYLTRKAAEILGDSYDQEIIEMHHRQKRDAPSGTAKRLAEILCEVKGKPYAELVRDGRQGEVGPRSPEEIGMHALRGGDVVGEHTVVFAGLGDRVEVRHGASNRDIFAQGALRAARWALTQPVGLYSMQDVLGLT